jgi:hypothetical protein
MTFLLLKADSRFYIYKVINEHAASKTISTYGHKKSEKQKLVTVILRSAYSET